MVPRIDIWFYGAMLASMAPVLRAADLDMLVYQVDGEEQRTRFLRELPARRKVDAVDPHRAADGPGARSNGWT